MSQPPARRDTSDVDTIAATTEYRELIERLRHRIRESQARAARALNTELVMLYWSIGRDIVAEQEAGHWGDGVVELSMQNVADRARPDPERRLSCVSDQRVSEIH
jgi:uncharacterized protein DUF1016